MRRISVQERFVAGAMWFLIYVTLVFLLTNTEWNPFAVLGIFILTIPAQAAAGILCFRKTS